MIKLPRFNMSNYTDVMSKPYAQQNTSNRLSFRDLVQSMQPSVIGLFKAVDARKLSDYLANNPVNGVFPIGNESFTMKDALIALKLAIPTTHLSDYFFRNEGQGTHIGIDLILPEGTPIESLSDGIVSKVKHRDGSSNNEGNCVVIKTLDNYYIGYEHLATIGVDVGDSITQGDLIGSCGSTGNSTQFHLHLQIDTPSSPFQPYWHEHAHNAKKYTIDPFVFLRAMSPLAVFSDLPYDHEQQTAIVTLKNAGIIKGHDGKVFPHNNLKRYEMALMIDRICNKYNLYAGLPIQNPVFIPYDDVNINDPELDDALERLQKHGIMKGHNSKFFPTNPLKGEEMLALLGRLFYGLQDASGADRRKPYVNKFLALGFISTNREYLGKSIPRKEVFVLERKVLKDKGHL